MFSEDPKQPRLQMNLTSQFFFHAVSSSYLDRQDRFTTSTETDSEIYRY